MISEAIRNLIKKLYSEYGSYRKVAKFAGVSDYSVRTIVLGLHKTVKKKPGPKPKIDQYTERMIVRAAKRAIKNNREVWASRIQAECDLQDLSTRTIQRKLRSLGIRLKEAERATIQPSFRREASSEINRAQGEKIKQER